MVNNSWWMMDFVWSNTQISLFREVAIYILCWANCTAGGISYLASIYSTGFTPGPAAKSTTTASTSTPESGSEWSGGRGWRGRGKLMPVNLLLSWGFFKVGFHFLLGGWWWRERWRTRSRSTRRVYFRCWRWDGRSTASFLCSTSSKTEGKSRSS